MCPHHVSLNLAHPLWNQTIKGWIQMYSSSLGVFCSSDCVSEGDVLPLSRKVWLWCIRCVLCTLTLLYTEKATGLESEDTEQKQAEINQSCNMWGQNPHTGVVQDNTYLPLGVIDQHSRTVATSEASVNLQTVHDPCAWKHSLPGSHSLPASQSSPQVLYQAPAAHIFVGSLLLSPVEEGLGELELGSNRRRPSRVL